MNPFSATSWRAWRAKRWLRSADGKRTVQEELARINARAISAQERETMLDLDAMQQRCAAATPGPWYPRATDDQMCMNARFVGLDAGPGWAHDNVLGMAGGSPDQENPERVVAITLLQSPNLASLAGQWEENTEFIAYARTDMPALLEEVCRLQEENARLRDQLMGTSPQGEP